MTPFNFGQLQPVMSGLRGFDCNTPVKFADAQALVKLGYRFALRYIPREKAHSYDLTPDEIRVLLRAGLAVMPVQHCEMGEWYVSAQKGKTYGKVAAMASLSLSFPPGTTVWLDLESVNTSCTPQEVIDYCKAWYNEVKFAGYLPGVYVGWHPGLNAHDLYYRLPFTRYWGAYNLDLDKRPAVSGICMTQQTALKTTRAAVSFDLQTDLVLGDSFGRFPFAFAPAEWDDTVR